MEPDHRIVPQRIIRYPVWLAICAALIMTACAPQPAPTVFRATEIPRQNNAPVYTPTPTATATLPPTNTPPATPTATGTPTSEPTPGIQTLTPRSEEHTSELQSRENLVCRLLLEKKKTSTHTRPQKS